MIYDKVEREMDLEQIGIRIREKRIQKSWSQEILACKADLSTMYISMIERGQKLPKLQTFLRIVDCLETTPDELLIDIFPDRYGEDQEYKCKIRQLNANEQAKIHKIIDAFLSEDE